MTDAPVHDLTLEILRSIRDEIAGMRQETNQRLEATNQRLEALRLETHQGFQVLGSRINNLLLGEHRREHNALRDRVTRLETHMGLELVTEP